MCSLVISPGNGLAARHIPFRFDRTKANAPEAADAPLGRMMYVRWAPGSNRKVLEADCIVPMTPVVTAALRAGFAAELDNVVRDNPGLGVASFRGDRSEPVQDFTGDWITCSWFQQDDSLVCNGVDCFASATVRMDDVNEMAIGSSYPCANGCTVAPWVGFACPGGGGGGAGDGEDPGEGGGGGGGDNGGGGEELPPASDHGEDNDQGMGLERPNCRLPWPPLSAQAAWCSGRTPEGTDLAVINAALDRMRMIGGICAYIANEAAALIGSGGFRLWRRTTEAFGGVAPRGGQWLVLSDYWVRYYTGTGLDPHGRNLDSEITHEMDHHLNFTGSSLGPGHHVLENGVENPYHTMHSRQCAPGPNW